MKRCAIVLSLVFALVNISPSFVIAGTQNAHELNEFGIKEFIYESNDLYSLSGIVYKNGYIDISICYADNPGTIYSAIIDESAESAPQLSHDIFNSQDASYLNITGLSSQGLENAYRRALNEKVILVTNIESNEANVSPESNRRITPASSEIERETHSALGPPLYRVFILGRSYAGHIGEIYQSRTYDIRPPSILLDIGEAALSVWSLKWDWSPLSILECVRLIRTSGILYRLAAGAKRQEWIIEQHFTKEVMVNGVCPHWAGKTVRYKALFGDIGIKFDETWTNKHSDFDNNPLLIETGIEHYLLGWY